MDEDAARESQRANARAARGRRWSVEVREPFSAQPLCIALANTRNWRHADAPLERLNAYADVSSSPGASGWSTTPARCASKRRRRATRASRRPSSRR